MPGNTLLLFTNEYPYGKGESFVEKELVLHSKHFKEVVLFPLVSLGVRRTVPQNVKVVNLFEEKSYNPTQTLFNNFIPFFKIIFYELYRSYSSAYFLKKFPYFKSILLQNFFRAELLKSYLSSKRKTHDMVFYSFWTDDWATALSILKWQGEIETFITRVHGYDLYKERWNGWVIPFRNFQLDNISKILAVSNDGLHYLQKEYPFYFNKFFLNHLTASDNGIGPFEQDHIFTIVSCSAVIPLKRVHLIVKLLKKIKYPIKWVHLGDGALLDEIKSECKELSENVITDLKGYTPHEQIIDFYKKNSVNLFVSLSETEGGVPLSLQEAASFGIPLLGVDVGGVSEIVNENTGILLPQNFNFNELKSTVDEFRSRRHSA